jgi:hypothetical protein
VLAGVWTLFRQAEPEYQGVKLSQCLESRDQVAIRHIGTNALPYLIATIRHQDSPFEKKLRAFSSKLPGPVKRVLGLQAPSVVPGHTRADDAVFGFQVLGPLATPVVPELGELANRVNSELAGRAIQALIGIGNAGIPGLAGVIVNPRNPNRRSVIRHISNLYLKGEDARSAVPALVRCLEDNDALVVEQAARVLGGLAVEERIVVPALAKVTSSPNENLRWNAASALMQFGPRAADAIPSLMELLRDPNADVRVVARNALKRIAPEALNGRAGE